MKKLFLSISALMTFCATGAMAQCTYNNSLYLTGTAPTVIGNSISAPQTWAGEFNRVEDMQAGYTYEISTCGSTTFDSELTVFPAGGGSWLAYDDDGCGTVGGSSKILFTPTTTGHYDIQLNEFGCLNNSIDMTMTVTLISTGGTSTPSALTIPVVVHVVYKNSNENISDLQIQSQLAALNADFRKLNADFSLTPTAFQGAGADMEIEFCLATTDPNGDPTTGITRTSTTTPSFSQANDPKSIVNGGIANWNPTQYLNMWVCDLSGGLLGYATFPSDLATEPWLDGVVIDYAYFGTMGTATAPFNKGRTATHEIGHWLNLRHIWGDGFCADDFVSDTPTQQESNGGCPLFPHVTCSNGANGDMFMNYMDYTDDACMFMFTHGQKQRADATFANIRTELATSTGCGITGTEDVHNVSSIRLYPNPAKNEVTLHSSGEKKIDGIEITDLSGRLVTAEITTANFYHFTINIETLKPGVYLVKVNMDNHRIIKKLVVQ